MHYSSARQGQLGVNVVERIVLKLGWRWQQLDAANDDGVDGLVFIEENGMPTGQILYVQVKCHSSRENTNGQICVTFKKDRLARNLEKWRRVVGGAILVHVHPEEPHACHWVNLLEADIAGASQVFVGKSQVFDRSQRIELARLCGTLHRDVLKPRVNTEAQDFDYIRTGAKQLQSEAKKFYKSLNDSALVFLDGKNSVKFRSEGWRHITRKGRNRLVQLQSMQLLGCLPSFIRNTTETSLEIGEKHDDGNFAIATSTITFPHRQTALVKLVMKRRLKADSYEYSFWTVYEARRKRDILGRR